MRSPSSRLTREQQVARQRHYRMLSNALDVAITVPVVSCPVADLYFLIVPSDRTPSGETHVEVMGECDGGPPDRALHQTIIIPDELRDRPGFASRLSALFAVIASFRSDGGPGVARLESW